jgi:hypothetical protein
MQTDNAQEAPSLVVQELVHLLPAENVGTGWLIATIVVGVIGAVIWIVGARYSRWILTLLAVLLGAALGKNLPGWLGWQISGAGPAVGAALLLGVTGFVLHGMWVGIGLGAVLCCWTAIGCWIGLRDAASWNWPPIGDGATLTSYLTSLWQTMPQNVTRLMPYCCAAAMVTGLAAAIIWPRLALLLGWSLAGTTLMVLAGIASLNFIRPELLGRLPSAAWAQATLLGSIIGMGALLQWRLGPRSAKAKPKKKSDDFDDEDDEYDDKD